MRISSVFASLASSSFLLVPLVVGCGDGGSASSTGGGGSGTTTPTGGGGAGGGTAGGGAGGVEFVMQPHPAFPELNGSKSAVIKSPKLVTITFPGDVNEADIQAVGDQLVTSDWIKAVGADYGVGDGTHLAKVVMPEPAPATLKESDLFTAVDQQIAAGLIPKPTADTMYMIYIPAPVDFSDDLGYHMCDDYLGYHWQVDLPSGTLTYAVVGDCMAGFEEVTATFAHEYIEMATDPGDVGGYYMQLAKTDPWASQNGQENADLCDYADYIVEAGYTYQRVWSNSAAAAAITSPCAPVDPTAVFYDVYAEPAPIPKVAAGQTATFTLTGWSTAPIPDWDLTFDADYYSEFKPTVELSQKTINNGTTVTVTLGVPANTPKGRLGTAMIYSGDGYGRFWPVSVRSD